MTTAELNQAIDGMTIWSDLRNDSGQMRTYLNQGGCFNFVPTGMAPITAPTKHQKSVEPIEENCIHAYPTIIGDELNFLVLNSAYDTKTLSLDVIAAHSSLCAIAPFIVPEKKNDSANTEGAIDDPEAWERINNWIEYHNPWIKEQVKTEDGMYQAFVIPTEDMLFGATHQAIFALVEEIPETPIKQDLDSTIYTADLIIENTSSSEVYMDTVMPVPPFRPGLTAKENFYLLSIAETR